MKKIFLNTCCFLILNIIIFSSCKKYLDVKSDKSLVIPETIQDAQSLLNEYTAMNGSAISEYGNLMDDNFYVTDKFFNGRNIYDRNLITWDKAATMQDAVWKFTYLYILNCNIALETLNKITPSSNEIASYNLTKGSALFYRAFFHYQLTLLFAKQYISATANSDLGIPYKTSSSGNNSTIRLTLQETYDLIIKDLKNAAIVLPITSTLISQPTRSAALGDLARVYLSMNDYTNAFKYSDSCLAISHDLLDYNNFNTNSSSPFPDFGLNAEIIFHATSGGSSILNYPNWNCDSNFYQSYNDNDLRKGLFFRKNNNGINTYSFKGTYDPSFGAPYPFSGITTDEQYLIRAECYARGGNVSSAMDDLNTLMVKRWNNTVPYPTISAVSANDALNKVLTERRKELVGRTNLRWSDLKRLNVDPNYAKTLIRAQNGTTYTLPPNDPRYVLLIPPSVIQMSGVQQNPR